MRRIVSISVLLFVWVGLAYGGLSVASAKGSPLRFSIVNSSGTDTLEALSYSGGSWWKKLHMNHMAVLVEHGDQRFLFDTGLGRQIHHQYEADMPWWMRPLMSYEPANPVRDQLDAAGYPVVTQVILSHVHWDHASGVPDFPEADIWIREADREFIKSAPRGPVMPTQFAHESLRWHDYALPAVPFLNFPQSLDLYGDGTAVLVGMEGHTPGAVGLYLKAQSGREFLFCGDTVWNARALEHGAPKMFLARITADHDGDATQKQIDLLMDLHRQRPDIEIVPAHDAHVHDQLGYFPAWVE